MNKKWLWLLSGLGACGGPLQFAPDVALKNQSDAALQRQVARLQAKRVKLAVAPAGPAGATLTVLSLEVLNPQELPGQPDTLRQRVRKLARLVVADLAQPDHYQVLNVQVVFRKSFFDASTHSLSFIYPLASLR